MDDSNGSLRFVAYASLYSVRSKKNRFSRESIFRWFTDALRLSFMSFGTSFINSGGGISAYREITHRRTRKNTSFLPKEPPMRDRFDRRKMRFGEKQIRAREIAGKTNSMSSG